ncbi:ABC transporter, ATP-binding protein [Capnocytophaga ochracea F0287]|uniref:ABC transporter, ATP-binding protein n=1 Tax=Capnocytophaga ochracea F0287 TaxID=873517 RepID=E4MQY5_CAPOC|nr:ABC-F family ATP-binding cassette domain-containing protein [Capnocytophaga ochracea]EFS97883.1 ABC transporter, ATP-binding protein [Capnocytophaga ochracea F0287]EJF43828.1 ABC transporter, ATP-binding protein [Capnocytophaga ochracea str. Holt 25]UEB43797.1 ABC-F family ATP-binding cassette domain-containing protein [Capnocytophaga ochracea]
MNLLSVENISKAFGERIILENISLGINKDQKIAFIAKNGTGKTTLLNIIAGKDQPDSGQVVFRKGIHIGFLSQNPSFNEELTVEETIFATDNPILRLIQEYEHALQHPENEMAYQKAFEQMERHNGWDFETQYKQILFRLKLDNLQLKVKNLSGGQKKRLALANVLISKPDLLILDEPTNHLDLEMIEWLEQYFSKENLTLFIVTHDRYFLERVCNEILELDNGELFSYKGNYSYFLEKKEQRLAQEQASVEKAKNLYVKELDWMRRQPKARTTKSKSRIDDFYKIKEAAHKRRKEHSVQLEINMERLGSKTVEFHNVSKSFGDLCVLNKFNYNFLRGERVGIIGKNGTGKSTFLNLLTLSITPDSGKIVVGDTIKFGYYTQDGIEVQQGQKVIEVIQKYGDYIPLLKGRTLSAGQLLERFLFDHKKQYDYVEKLSGGELKRLYLCTVLIQNPNFLILDEPTNDLDIVTLNVLEDFLLDYPGCLVVVSHDRYFMDKIVDHLFVFKGNGEVEDFPGNYTDYRVYEESVPPTDDTPKKEATKNTWRKDGMKGLSFNEQKEYNRLEKEIAQLEEKKTAIEATFAEGSLSSNEIQEQSVALQETLTAIEEKTERWFELTEKLEEH